MGGSGNRLVFAGSHVHGPVHIFLPLLFSSPASSLSISDSILFTYLVLVFQTASGLDPPRPAFALCRALLVAVANGVTQEALPSGRRAAQSAKPRVRLYEDPAVQQTKDEAFPTYRTIELISILQWRTWIFLVECQLKFLSHSCLFCSE